jgi:hypothetical protein
MTASVSLVIDSPVEMLAINYKADDMQSHRLYVTGFAEYGLSTPTAVELIQDLPEYRKMKMPPNDQ